MILKILGSSSKGNCYILENDHEALIIECGVSIKKIKQSLGFNLSKVSACIVTHEHLDHSVAIKDVLSSGIKVHATKGTHAARKTTDHHNARWILQSVKGDASYSNFFVGGFYIKAFKVNHDAAEPVGFLIKHQECGTVLFLTDTYYCGYTFKGLNNIIIEANYSQEILDRRLREGASPEFLRNRVLQSHMSLSTCKDMLRANDLRAVNNVVLIHLSDSNSDAALFKTEVEECTGKTVHIAEPGMTIEYFNKQPF